VGSTGLSWSDTGWAREIAAVTSQWLGAFSDRDAEPPTKGSIVTVAEATPTPKLHRPYSRLRGRPERSVTEIIGLKAIPGLPWGAAKETALFAVNHQDQWAELDTDAAVDRLRTHHRGVWDSRAAIGTACHAVMESWFAGETVDLEALVCDMAENDYAAKTWRGAEEDAIERLIGYVDGLEKWWNDWQPSGGTSEDCIRTPGVYVGQRDRWGVQMGGASWGLDLKTTAEQEASKALYYDSWCLQLTAYSRADEVVDYGLDENGKVIELGTRPNEPVEKHGIIHLRGDGNYALYPVEVTDASFEAFLGLARVGKWLRSVEKLEMVPAALS